MYERRIWNSSWIDMYVLLMLFLQLIIMFVFVVGCCTICTSEATSEGRRVGGLCLLPLIVHLLSIINSKNYLFVVYVLYNVCIKKDIFTYFTFWCFLINVKYIGIVWSVVSGNCPILFFLFLCLLQLCFFALIFLIFSEFWRSYNF